MYESISEAKKAYKAAYAWGLKVQRACLLKKVYIEVVSGYTDGNYRDGDIDAWFIEVHVWDYENRAIIKAEWCAYEDNSKFENEKAAIIAYLESKGITIK